MKLDLVGNQSGDVIVALTKDEVEGHKIFDLLLALGKTMLEAQQEVQRIYPMLTDEFLTWLIN